MAYSISGIILSVLMSPSNFSVDDTAARELILNSDGNVNQNAYVTNSNGVRAVINLKSDTQISGGIGTSNDPFVVSGYRVIG